MLFNLINSKRDKIEPKIMVIWNKDGTINLILNFTKQCVSIHLRTVYSIFLFLKL